MSALKLESKTRTERGKNAAGRKRREGIIPGNLMAEAKSTPIEIDSRVFGRMLAAGLRPSSLIELSVDGQEARRVIVRELQRNPVSGTPVHVDFLQVVPGRKVTVKISVETTGISKGVKGGGALEHFIRVLKVRATPESLQDVVKVDITNMDVGDSVHVSDLGLPPEWEVDVRGNPIVLTISRSRMAQATTGEPGAAEPATEG